MLRLNQRALNFGGCDGDTVPVLQNVVARDRLTVDTDQEVRRLLTGHFLVKEFLNGQSLCDINVIGEAAVELSRSLTTPARLQNRT